jgi:tryptophanyl-tRNA synthetase
MIAQRKRILTGDRPTGPLHLGHFAGSLINRVRLQHEYETYVLIADLQALTDYAERPDMIRQAVREVILDNLAAGVDPDAATIVVQSTVPQIAELTMYYLNLMTLARLQRNPTVKEEMRQKGYGANVPAGFLVYPVSQAADITAFGAHIVPVGQDQMPVIEQTREIVRRFNGLFGPVLVEPEGLLSHTPRLPGIDGKAKAGKSLGNAIYLSDDPETVEPKVMRMFTDPTRARVTDPGHIEGNVVFAYLDAFDPRREELEQLRQDYRKGGVADVAVKRRLVKVLDELLSPMRARRRMLAAKRGLIEDLIVVGAKKAGPVAAATLTAVRDAMGLNFSQRPRHVAP